LRTHIIAGLIFSAILISCACIHGADTIELPFDYFYGRWTTGHFLDGKVAYTKEDVIGRRSYFYTSERERVGLDNIPRYLVISTQNDERLFTPSFSYFRRPTSNWQIGLDSLQYVELYYNAERCESMRDIRRQSGLVVRSNWMNSSTCDIAAYNAPFMYSFGPILGSGQLRLRNHVSLRYSEFSGGIDYVPSFTNLSFLRSYDGQIYEWVSENSLQWGIRSNLNLFLDLGLVYATATDAENYYKDDNRAGRVSYYTDDQSFRRDYQPNYSIGALYCRLNPLFLKGVFRQTYSQTSEDARVDVMPVREPVVSTDTKRSGDVQESQTSFSLTTYYISHGEFDPHVVLDDYNGHYRNMLFHNQFAGYFEVLTETAGRAMYADQNHARIDLSASYGLWNHLEVTVNTAYEWTEKDDSAWVLWRREESRTMDFTLKYRSYTYHPGEGPGWSRDDRYDILFGVTPQFGQVYVEAKYSPPIYKGYYRDEVGFLAFEDMEKGEQSQLNVETSFGLGRKFVLTSSHVVSYLHGSLSNHKFAFNLRHRVRNVELSLQYKEIYVNSGFDDATIIGRLRILL